MLSDATLQRFQTHPLLAQLSPEIIHWATEADSVPQLLETALRSMLQVTGASAIALARPNQGDWQVRASVGRTDPLPSDLMAEALDTNRAQSAGDWSVAPLRHRADAGELLLARTPGGAPPDFLTSVELLAELLGSLIETVRTREHQVRRIRRLEAILEIAAQWNQATEMVPLLTQMAQTSTRLLGAERASIFLWDKPNKTLVGRPALGVEGGELRIPDDRGIVGQVVQSGQPRRIDVGRDQNEINRQVDKDLSFETRTLLCVPLRGKSGQLFGAFELINKVDGNFSQDDEDGLVELAAHAGIALENTQEYQQLLTSRRNMADHAAERIRLVGESPAVQAIRSTISRVADTDLAVLILGENGTGKEVASQLMHYLSRRRDEACVAVNCAALTETLLESELFGHEKGAFTDAHDTRAGKFELASGGTLFLDEIGDLSLGGQAKLLRVLEEKIVVRVGGSTPIHVDTRVIAATNQNLAEMVRNRKFREDLYFRLNVVTIELPALRARGDDILLLAEHFLRDFCAKARRKMPKFTAAARKRLLQHPWPGNVRELRNLMERLAYLSQGDKIDVGDLAFILSPESGGGDTLALDMSLADATVRFQSEYIKRQIKAARDNMSAAAKRLGLHRSNLYRKMRQLGMSTGEEGEPEAGDGAEA